MLHVFVYINVGTQQTHHLATMTVDLYLNVEMSSNDKTQKRVAGSAMSSGASCSEGFETGVWELSFVA